MEAAYNFLSSYQRGAGASSSSCMRRRPTLHAHLMSMRSFWSVWSFAFSRASCTSYGVVSHIVKDATLRTLSHCNGLGAATPTSEGVNKHRAWRNRWGVRMGRLT